MARSRRTTFVRATGVAGGVALLVMGLALGFVAPAAADSMPPTVPPDAGGLLPGLDARLVGVAVVYATNGGDAIALRVAQDRVNALSAEREQLKAAMLMLALRMRELTAEQYKAAQDLMIAESNLRRLSALVYQNGNTGWQAVGFYEVTTALDASRVDKLGVSLTEQLVKAQKAAKAARKRASEEAAKVAIQQVASQERLAQIEDVELPWAQREVATLSVTAANSVAGAAVVSLGIPVATLDAYLRAEAALGRERPGCGLAWWMLAGIGRVESNHGRYGGAQPSARGNVVPRIIGIALDGRPGIAAISDSDDGVWDGDTVWDRAVGPMQFIPSTWRSHMADGNGDGAADPHNVYDTALAAGRYLCTAAGRLGDDASLTRAYLSYNHSDVYAAHVLNLARTYQSIGLPRPG